VGTAANLLTGPPHPSLSPRWLPDGGGRGLEQLAMTLEKNRRHRGQPLKLNTRPLQFGQRVLLRLAHTSLAAICPEAMF
jgi:hypothetical protein